MKRALALAERGRGFVSPNPLVGAVFVKDGEIVGEGWHQKCGEPHAEVNAIKNASTDLKGSTLYVSLEPCCVVGKTPACTDSLLSLRLERVVVAVEDPNPAVSGKGVEILRNAGIKVDVGILGDEARLLNQIFFKTIISELPYLILKSGVSFDGKIATYTGESKWITSDESRKKVHELRSSVDAILTSGKTVCVDDCHLGVRDVEGKDPLRVIVDSKLKTPLGAQVYRDDNVVVYAAVTVGTEQIAVFKDKGIEVTLCEEDVFLVNVLKDLYRKGVRSVLVEAGGGLNSGFIDIDLIDRYMVFIAPKLIGGATSPSFFEGKGHEHLIDAEVLDFKRVEMVGSDILVDAVRHFY